MKLQYFTCCRYCRMSQMFKEHQMFYVSFTFALRKFRWSRLDRDRKSTAFTFTCANFHRLVAQFIFTEMLEVKITKI